MRETTEDYCWTLQAAHDVFGGLDVKVVVTECERALMNAISTQLPNAKQMLCSWHVYQNISAHCKMLFSDEQGWERWLKQWHDVVYKETEEQFDTAWQILSATSPSTGLTNR